MPTEKWALVTGVSAGGMGDAEVKAFLARGVNVIATAISIDVLDYLQSEKAVWRASLHCEQLDVTSRESIDQAVGRVEKITGGRLDFLMNNAGYGYYMPLMDVDIEKAEKQYDVNVWGVLRMTQAFFPMLRAAKGTVVNQSSIASLPGFNRPYMAVYSSSKAAVQSLSDALRVELAPFEIKVISLVTGAVKTEFFNHKVGGKSATLPPSSPYAPIRKQVETMMNSSLGSGGGHNRFSVTKSTVAALLVNGYFSLRYIRRGSRSRMFWLMHMLLPVWLMDRLARHTGSLDVLKRLLKSTG